MSLIHISHVARQEFISEVRKAKQSVIAAHTDESTVVGEKKAKKPKPVRTVLDRFKPKKQKPRN